jgi:hypothetical protein
MPLKDILQKGLVACLSDHRADPRDCLSHEGKRNRPYTNKAFARRISGGRQIDGFEAI